MKSKGNTIFWAITACLLWSTAYAGIKLGLQYDTPFHFAGIRFIISGLIILPFTVRPSLYIKMVKENRGVFFGVTLLQIVLNYSLFYQGLNLVPGALGSVETVPKGPQPIQYWMILGWLSFMASAAFSIWFKLLQRPGVKVSELNLWKFLTPVTGALLSWLLIKDEYPEWLTIAGMVIITISLIMYYRKPGKIIPVQEIWLI